MNLREIFQETRGVCKKNSSTFLGFYMAIFIIFFAVMIAFTFVGPEWSFLLIFGSFGLVVPLFVGLDFIAKKAVGGEEIEYRDFYLGHKNFFTSITLETKVLTRGILFGILGVFAATFIATFGVMYFVFLENPEIKEMVYQVASGKETIENLALAISSITWMETAINIIDIVSLLTGVIFYIWQGKRYTFLPYICFETRFNLHTALFLSRECSERIKKPFFGYNLIYVLILVLIVGTSVGAFFLLNLVLSELISLVIAIGVGSLLAAPVFLEYKVSLYVIYAKYFKTEIDATFKAKLEEAKQKSNM